MKSVAMVDRTENLDVLLDFLLDGRRCVERGTDDNGFGVDGRVLTALGRGRRGDCFIGGQAGGRSAFKVR
jgi:hypothetical protein